MEKFAVIGLGRFGKTLATTLSQNGAEVMAIDRNPELVEDLKDEVAFPIALDATDIKALEAQDIKNFDTCIVAIGNNFEGMLLTTVNLLKLDVNKIISRCMTQTQQMILERLGIEHIILPEVQVAANLAENLMHPQLKSFLKLADNYEVAEINVSGKLNNKSLMELNMRKKFNLNVIAIEREVSQEVKGEKEMRKKVIGITDPQTVILENDTLLVIGKDKDLRKFIDLHID